MCEGMISRRTLFAAPLALAGLAPQANARGRMELVMFERQGCVWCRRWHDLVGKSYPLSPEGQAAPLRRHDLDVTPASDLRLSEPVRYTPTFVLAGGGFERARITGFIDDSSFYGLLARHIADQKALAADG
jgi:thioredoxin-related protein